MRVPWFVQDGTPKSEGPAGGRHMPPPRTTDVYQRGRGTQYYCVYIVFSPQSNDSVMHDRGCSATLRYYRSPTHTRHRTPNLLPAASRCPSFRSPLYLSLVH
jgi:hypothetical protein